MNFPFRAILMTIALCGSTFAYAQSGSIVQDEHDQRIKADTERYTKYHNNADDYPKPMDPTLVIPASRPKSKAPGYTQKEILEEEMNRQRRAWGAEAFAEDRRGALAGDLRATYGLAYDYQYGSGTDFDPFQGYRIYLSIAPTYPPALTAAGEMLYYGKGSVGWMKGIPGDEVAGYKMINAAASAGEPAAIKFLKENPEPTRHLGEFPAKVTSMLTYADEAFREQASRVSPTSLAVTDRLIAEMGKRGKDGSLDSKKIVKNEDQMLAVAKANLYGVGVPVDLDRAYTLFSLVHERGYSPEPAGYLEWLYKTGTPAHPSDLAEIYKMGTYSRSSLRDQYVLAIYFATTGGPNEQRRVLTDALCHSGICPDDKFLSGQVLTDLAVMQLEGNGGPVDQKAGLANLNLAATVNRNAQYVLGLVYEGGLNDVPKDLVKANQLFQAASSAGQMDARAHLATKP